MNNKSYVWNYYEKNFPGSATCGLCNKVLGCKMSSTSALSRHLKVKHGIDAPEKRDEDSKTYSQTSAENPKKTESVNEFMNVQNYMPFQAMIPNENSLISLQKEPGTNADSTKNSQTNIDQYQVKKVTVQTPDDFLKDPLEGYSPSVTKKIKITGQYAPDVAKTSAVNVPKWPNRHVAFIQSIAPTLDTLDEDEIFEFQCSVIESIKSIKLRRTKTENRLKHPYLYIGKTSSPYPNTSDRSTSRSNLESLKSNSSADPEDNLLDCMSDSSCTSDDL